MAKNYVYRNADDSIRVVIQTRYFVGADNPGADREWDLDIFEKGKKEVRTFSGETGDVCYSKREAKEWAENEFGKLTSINPANTITEGWEV